MNKHDALSSLNYLWGYLIAKMESEHIDSSVISKTNERFEDIGDYIYEEPEWISCTEMLPFDEMRVLMQLDNALCIVGYYDRVTKEWIAFPSIECDTDYEAVA